MAFSATFEENIAIGGVTRHKTNTISNSGRTSFDESVATGETDYEINIDLDVSAVKAFFLVSDQNVTFEVNDGAGAGGSLSLVANIPYIWYTNKYDSFTFGTDWTSVFITNASGSTASIQCEAIYDATP